MLRLAGKRDKNLDRRNGLLEGEVNVLLNEDREVAVVSTKFRLGLIFCEENGNKLGGG